MRRWCAMLLSLAVLPVARAADREVPPGVWRYDLTDGRLTPLGAGSAPAWCAAAQAVVYLRGGSSGGQPTLVQADGSHPRALLKVPAKPGWQALRPSADGSLLALLRVRYDRSDGQEFPTWPVELAVYRADGRVRLAPTVIGRWEFEQYADVGDLVGWSPRGHRLAVKPSRPDQQVPYVWDLDNDRRTKLTGTPNAQGEQIWRLGPRELVLQRLWQPTFSGDGQWLAFGAFNQGIVAVKLADPTQRRLVSTVAGPFGALPGGTDFVDAELHQRRLDGSSVRRWSWPGGQGALRMSACGEWLAFHGQALRDGTAELRDGLWLARPDGSTARAARYAGVADSIGLALSAPPVWLPGGDEVIFAVRSDAASG
ncbi:MAG: hypothetical protein IT204_08995 [Fimbriimonadaceae bacterium]|nr:hypothetical protein [Fimbriimonadaceae bacterium]